MYTGQFGIALAGKGLHPRIPLWGLILAAFGLDLVSSTLKLIGHSGLLKTWAESGAGALVVAALAALVYRLFRRGDGRGTFLMAGVALLHLPADLAANEVPLWPGGPRLGAALYKHPIADFAVEGVVVLAGWLIYRRSLPAGGRRWPAWASLILLVGLQAAFSFDWRSW